MNAALVWLQDVDSSPTNKNAPKQYSGSSTQTNIAHRVSKKTQPLSRQALMFSRPGGYYLGQQILHSNYI